VIGKQRTKPLRADAARNHRALIEAARRLFASRGLVVTLDEIAAEAGVNVATAYRHFANKYELAESFLQERIAEAVAVAEAAAKEEDPWTGLERFLSETLRAMAENRGMHDLFSSGFADRFLEELDRRIEPPLARLLARCKKAGQLRAEVDVGDLGVLLQMLAAVSGINSDQRSELVNRYLDLLLAGLRRGGRPLRGRPPTPREAREAAMLAKQAAVAAKELNRIRSAGQGRRAGP